MNKLCCPFAKSRSSRLQKHFSRLGPVLLAVALLLFSSSVFGQGQQPAEDTRKGTQEGQKPSLGEGAPTAPRVVGQARTQEEFEAWIALSQASSLDEKIQLGEQFLKQYPDSGLTSYVRKEMSLAYYTQGDDQEFIREAEKALEELSGDPVLLPTLARVYAEAGETDKAMSRAQAALESLETLERPTGIPSGQWISQKEQAMADAEYAYGLALLRRAAETSGDKNSILREAEQRFKRALALDPRFEYAYFRLGSVHIRLNEAEPAIANFASVAALDGVASSIAREQLERIFEALGRDTKGISEIIQEQRTLLKEKVAEKEAKIQKLEQEAQQEQQLEEQLLLPPPPQ